MNISLNTCSSFISLANLGTQGFSVSSSDNITHHQFLEQGVVGHGLMGLMPNMLSGLFREGVAPHRILTPKQACQEDFFQAQHLVSGAAEHLSQQTPSENVTASARKALDMGARVFLGLQIAAAPAKRIVTDKGRRAILGQGRLANMVFSRARDILEAREKQQPCVSKPICSAAVILPMTEWNSHNNDVGNTMKEVLYLVQREFLASEHKTTTSFLKSFSVDSLLEDQETIAGQVTLEKQNKTGQTTVVNGVIVAAQLHDSSKLKHYLENIDKIVFGIIKALIEKKQALENADHLSLKEKAALSKIESLVGSFSFDSSGALLISYNEKGVLHQVPFEKLHLNLVSGGVATYDTSLEQHENFTKDKALHNLIWIRKEVQRMRDEAIKNAELAAAQKGSNNLLIDSPQAKERVDQSWRDGSRLSADDVLRGLTAIIQDTEMNANNRPRKYADDPKTNVFDQQRQRTKERLFKGVDWNDLAMTEQGNDRGIALETAIHYLQKTQTNVTGASSPDELAQNWLRALEDPALASSPSLAAKEFSQAIESLFFESINNARVLALYHECGGFVDPQRIMRTFYALQAELFDNMMALYSLGSVNSQGYGEKVATVSKKLKDIVEKSNALLSFVGHDIRDRETRPREIIAPAAQEMVTTFYKQLKDNNITVENPGYHIIGFEAKNAKVLDREGNPIGPDHVVDTNMIKMRGIARLVASEIFGTSSNGAAIPVESYAQGDEMVAFFPKHKKDGQPVTLEEINAAYRKVLSIIFPQKNLHYNHKQDVDKGTLRLKEWRVRATINAPGFPSTEEEYIIATDKDAFETPASDEQRFWVLAKGKARLSKSHQGSLQKNDLQINHIQPILGPVGVRLCALSMPLEPKNERSTMSESEINAQLDKHLDLAMALDAQVKEEIKSAEKNGEEWGAPEKDLWFFDIERSSFSRFGLPA
jgi:hypothetical protein